MKLIGRLMIVLCSSLLSVVSVYACSGNTIKEDGKPIVPGCQRLDIVVHNMTQYTFVFDTASVTSGTNQHFSSIPPDTTGPTTLYIDGASVDNDVVKASASYYATKDGVRKGPTMTFTLQKDACYSHKPDIVLDDDHCYTNYGYPCPTLDNPLKTCSTCQLSGSCDGGASSCWKCDATCDSVANCGNDTNCGFKLESDSVCYTDYRYDKIDAKGLPDISSSNVNSSVTVDAGLYTLGAVLNSSGTNIEGTADSSVLYTNYALFKPNKQTAECGDTDSCSGGTDEYNKEAKLEFYVYPSPIETLTVTFPFNTSSAIGKIMRDVIYNNLDTSSLASLGTYYSVNPVSIQDKSIAFSTLCNADTCPKP